MNSITFCLLLGAIVALSVVNLHRYSALARKAGEHWLTGLLYLVAPVILSAWAVVIMMNWRKK